MEMLSLLGGDSRSILRIMILTKSPLSIKAVHMAYELSSILAPSMAV